MLDYSDIKLPAEHRYQSFALKTKIVQKILEKATIERHFKNIGSLDKPTVLEKVWKEFNTLSNKECGMPIQQVIIWPLVFRKVYKVIFPSLLDLRRSLQEHIPSPAFVPPSRRPRPPLPPPLPAIARRPYVLRTEDDYAIPPPADIRPCYRPGRILTPSNELERQQRAGPKMKTRPAASFETIGDPTTNETAAPQTTRSKCKLVQYFTCKMMRTMSSR
jgi:hypothetical protein